MLPTKKQVKVELAGLFIVGIKGPKLNAEADKVKKQGWFEKMKNKAKKKA